MRRLLLIALISVLLAVGAYSASQATQNLHYVFPNEAGKVLHASSFDAFEDEWERADGRLSARLQDGVMRLEVKEAGSGVYSPAYPYLTDFDLTVSATVTADDALENAFGVLFNRVDNQNYSVFLISTDGYYRLEKTVNGKTSTVSTWIDSPTIKSGLGETNALRVTRTGDEFRFYVNDAQMPLCIHPDGGESTYSAGRCLLTADTTTPLLESYQDAQAPANGQLGVTAITLNNGGGLIVHFDNWIVRGIAP